MKDRKTFLQIWITPITELHPTARDIVSNLLSSPPLTLANVGVIPFPAQRLSIIGVTRVIYSRVDAAIAKIAKRDRPREENGTRVSRNTRERLASLSGCD